MRRRIELAPMKLLLTAPEGKLLEIVTSLNAHGLGSECVY